MQLEWTEKYGGWIYSSLVLITPVDPESSSIGRLIHCESNKKNLHFKVCSFLALVGG